MPTLIPPTRAIRRRSAKRLHISDEVYRGDPANMDRPREKTMCGQLLQPLSTKVTIVRTADQITCDDCLVAAISKGRAR